MANTDYFISVVMCAYNAGTFIARGLNSILMQTRPADEIIVVDDGSTDNTADVVRSFGDKVTLIRQPNAGAAAARNAGIHAARGNLIAFLDADDEWLPHRLERQLEILEHHPGLVWVTGNYLSCSCDEDWRAPYVSAQRLERLLHGSDIIRDYLQSCIGDFGGHTDTMLIRKEAIIEAGLFRPELKKAEDIDLWWRIAYRHPTAGYAAEPIAIYHLASGESLNATRVNGSFFADLIKRHLELSAAHGREDTFRRLAAVRLRGWMRSMFFTAQKEDIRLLLSEFKGLLPAWYRGWMHALTAFPKITTAGCLLISRLVRALRLRRRVVPKPPSKPDNSKSILK